MTVDLRCACDCFDENRTFPPSPCQAQATQEDLLCDPCRLLVVLQAEMNDGRRRRTGTHLGTPPSRPGPHSHIHPDLEAV